MGTLEKADLLSAIKRFTTHTPPTKDDPALSGGGEVRSLLIQWNLNEFTNLFIRGGYQQVADMIYLTEKDVRALGLTKDGDVLRAMALVSFLQKAHRKMSLEHDALFLDPEALDVPERLKVTLEVLADLTYDDLKEMGVTEVGERRKLLRAISLWRDERDMLKTDAIRTKLSAAVQRADPTQSDVEQRIGMLRKQVTQMQLWN